MSVSAIPRQRRARGRPAGPMSVAVRGPRVRFSVDDYDLMRCVDSPPEIFHPSTAQQLESARFECAQCPLRAKCLAVGIRNQEWGVWGGILLAEGHPQRTVRKPSLADQVASVAG